MKFFFTSWTVHQLRWANQRKEKRRTTKTFFGIGTNVDRSVSITRFYLKIISFVFYKTTQPLKLIQLLLVKNEGSKMNNFNILNRYPYSPSIRCVPTIMGDQAGGSGTLHNFSALVSCKCKIIYFVNYIMVQPLTSLLYVHRKHAA